MALRLSDSFSSAHSVPLEHCGRDGAYPHGDDPQRRYYVRNANGARVVQIHLNLMPVPA